MHRVSPRTITVWAAVVTTAMLTGCGHQVRSAPSSLLVTDASTRTANVYLIAGYDRNNLWNNYNGYANGQLVVSVPLGYRVVLHVANDGGIPYDAGVYTKDRQLAFPGAGSSTAAYMNNPTAGIAPGSSVTYSFVANRVGDYRLADFLYRFPQHSPSHLPIGMWGIFRVTPAGAPAVSTT